MAKGPERWTVAVVGGGPAGSATAVSLARRGVEGVVLFDASPAGEEAGTRRPAIGESIPPAATPLLRELGVLGDMDRDGHLPCPGSQSLWGGPRTGFNDFLFDPEGSGFHLDRALFDARLRETAARAGVEVRPGARLRTVVEDEDGARLEVAGPDGTPTAHRARLVVDATGARGAVTRRLSIARNVLDNLVSVCALVDVPPGSVRCDYTLVEATEQGWWYAARLPRDRLIVSFTSDPATLRQGRLHAQPHWSRALEGTRLVGPEVADALAGAPALVTRAAPVMILSAVVGPAWLAVGDAASCWDPIGSGGITKALMHGMAAGAAVEERLGSGSTTGLARYQDRVFADFTDHVNLRYRLYGSEDRWPRSPFWAAREAGVVAVP